MPAKHRWKSPPGAEPRNGPTQSAARRVDNAHEWCRAFGDNIVDHIFSLAGKKKCVFDIIGLRIKPRILHSVFYHFKAKHRAKRLEKRVGMEEMSGLRAMQSDAERLTTTQFRKPALASVR